MYPSCSLTDILFRNAWVLSEANQLDFTTWGKVLKYLVLSDMEHSTVYFADFIGTLQILLVTCV